MAVTVQVRRVYDPPGPDDGTRVLVDRLWPHRARATGAIRGSGSLAGTGTARNSDIAHCDQAAGDQWSRGAGRDPPPLTSATSCRVAGGVRQDKRLLPIAELTALTPEARPRKCSAKIIQPGSGFGSHLC